MNTNQTTPVFNPVGVLYIGDPHACSRNPGRRMDDYLSSTLNKLSQAAKICKEENLFPVLLGDLIHDKEESSVVLLNRIIDVLREFPVAPLAIGGNHNRHESVYSEQDIEHLLDKVGAIRLIREYGHAVSFKSNGAPINFHVVPHGANIPKKLPQKPAGLNILLTHHDLPFQGMYKKDGVGLQEIANCTMVVNGHIHNQLPVEQVGATLYANPGNIENLTFDLKDQKPAVWAWFFSESDFTLHPRYLICGAMWNETGKRVKAADATESVNALLEEQPGLGNFAAALKEGDFGSELADSMNDGEELRVDLEDAMSASKLSDPAQLIIRSLLGKVLTENGSISA